MDVPRDVILISTADWDHPFWTNKQHTACQLAQHGFRVLYVESLGLRRPSTGGRDLARLWRRLRRAAAPPRKVRDNLWVTAPLVLPLHGRRSVRWLNDRLLVAALGRACREIGLVRPMVWTYNPLVGRVAESLRASFLVYHCVDDLSAIPHAPAATIAAAERDIAGRADLILTTSPGLQSRLSAWRPDATHLLPNVADYDHFSRAQQAGRLPGDLECIGRPRIGFIGAISQYKVDFELIAAVARLRPQWQWVLIGQVGEGQPDTQLAGLDQPNIHLLGPRRYEELPDYLRGFDVATIPARRNPYTDCMFPMKFFEYLAAGRPVVASRIPALAEFSSACELVDTPGEFAAALDRVLAGEGPNQTAGDALARRYTWDWRIRQMLDLLEHHWDRRQSAVEERASLAAPGNSTGSKRDAA